MPQLEGKPPDPSNQGIQSYVPFRDLQIHRSEILLLYISGFDHIVKKQAMRVRLYKEIIPFIYSIQP